jgi:hypothetical protein
MQLDPAGILLNELVDAVRLFRKTGRQDTSDTTRGRLRAGRRAAQRGRLIERTDWCPSELGSICTVFSLSTPDRVLSARLSWILGDIWRYDQPWSAIKTQTVPSIAQAVKASRSTGQLDYFPHTSVSSWVAAPLLAAILKKLIGSWGKPVAVFGFLNGIPRPSLAHARFLSRPPLTTSRLTAKYILSRRLLGAGTHFQQARL